MIAACFLILLNVDCGFTSYQNVPLPLGTVEELTLSPNTTYRLILKDPPDFHDQFWSFEAHSFNSKDHLAQAPNTKTWVQRVLIRALCLQSLGPKGKFLNTKCLSF